MQYSELFSLPFSFHCSMQNIGFSNLGYVIKPPQPSSTIYRALPFTGHQDLSLKKIKKKKTKRKSAR